MIGSYCAKNETVGMLKGLTFNYVDGLTYFAPR